MAIRFSILGSSSSGNCALLLADDCRILIDAGFSARRIAEMLESAGQRLESIDAIFLTHEHGDHCAGLNGMRRLAHIPVFANRGTAEAVQRGLRHRPNWHLFETGTRFQFRGLEVETFMLPHDAMEPVAFVVSHGQGDLFSPRRSLAWVTDLGYASELVRQRVAHVDLLVLESNHDLAMLRDDRRRPWSVKQRISGRHGHLSNEAARELLASIEQPRWRHVCLAHLSRDCNSLGAVDATFAGLRDAGPRFSLTIARPDQAGPSFDLA